MSSAGKKLQDIYNAGASRLGDLATASRAALNQTVNNQIYVGKDLRQQTRDHLIAREQELESEIQSLLSNMAIRIQSVIASETRQTQIHLKELQRRLSFVTQALTGKIADLKSSRETLSRASLEDLVNRYRQEINDILSELHKAQRGVSTGLRETHAKSSSNFAKRLDSYLFDIHAHEEQVKSECRRAYENKDALFQNRLQELIDYASARHKEYMDSLEEAGSISASELSQNAEVLAGQSERRYLDACARMQGYFEKLGGECESELSAGIDQQSRRLQSIYDAGVLQISHMVKELHGEVGIQGSESRKVLESAIKDVRARADGAIASFNENVSRHLDSSLHLQKELEKSNEEILSKIRKEFTTIKSAFHKTLDEAIVKTSEQLTRYSVGCEKQITEARNSSESELQSHFAKTRRQIQDSIAALLEKINSHKEQSLDDLRTAAGVLEQVDSSPAQRTSPVSDSGAVGGSVPLKFKFPFRHNRPTDASNKPSPKERDK